MKNIQVIDGGQNCGYWIYEVPDDAFGMIFPGLGQDVEFIEDFIHRVGEAMADRLLEPIWRVRLEKKDAMGIHGTLFYDQDFKKVFYPNRRDADLDDSRIQAAARVRGARRGSRAGAKGIDPR